MTSVRNSLGMGAAGWDERTYVLKGTGRLPLCGADLASLGPAAYRFPLFG